MTVNRAAVSTPVGPDYPTARHPVHGAKPMLISTLSRMGMPPSSPTVGGTILHTFRHSSPDRYQVCSPSVPERTASSPLHIEISYPEKPIPAGIVAQDTQLLNTFFKQQDLLRKKESDNCPLYARITRNSMYGRSSGLDDRTPNLNGPDESNTLAHCHPKYVR